MPPPPRAGPPPDQAARLLPRAAPLLREQHQRAAGRSQCRQAGSGLQAAACAEAVPWGQRHHGTGPGSTQELQQPQEVHRRGGVDWRGVWGAWAEQLFAHSQHLTIIEFVAAVNLPLLAKGCGDQQVTV